MPDVRSQPEPRASSTACTTPGHRPRRETQHQAPTQGFTLRIRTCPGTTADASPRVPSRKSNTHTVARTSLLPAFTPRPRVITAPLGWAPNGTSHFTPRPFRSCGSDTHFPAASHRRLHSERWAPLTGTARVSRSHQAPYVAAVSVFSSQAQLLSNLGMQRTRCARR